MNHSSSRPRGASRSRPALRRAPDAPQGVREPAPTGVCEWRQAVVLRVQGPSVTLDVDDQPRAARIAFGCLVAVCEGDVVAVLVQAGQCWITTVLERAGCQDVALRSNAGLELHATHIRVHAQESLNLQAQQAALNCGQAHLISRGLQVVSSSIKTLGAVLETVFDTVRHYSKQHQRTTDGVDRTRAQHLELNAEQLMQLHAAHTLIDGEKLVKARGAQIHFG